ncbi:MAG TPA: HlyD family secretion protein [Candidatus Angelobacter sp.]|nr:HlyD family secretion protein [Candidatus Angelobacter sp.]
MNAAVQKIDPAPKPVAVPNVPPVTAPVAAPAPRRKRRLLRTALLVLGPLVLLIGGAYFYVTGARFVSTDNAYVKADIAAISPEVSGRVIAVAVANNDPVKAGQVLFRLDDQPFKLAQAQAEAQLKTTHDDILAQQASYRQKKVEIEMAQQNIDFYQRELVIYDKMSKNNLVAQTQVDEAHHNLTVAQQQLPALQQELSGILAQLGGEAEGAPEQNARYLAAQAARDQAALDLSRTEVHAPANGNIANLTLRPGDYIKTGMPIFSLVETDHLWVEANFKETDLTHVLAGQPATVTVDTYPDMACRIRVGSISAATGAEFALLPPQNSSGNWVKVVQRIPVRLEIVGCANQLPLRAGMSATIEIDTGYQRALPGLVTSALAWIGAGK